ncbi:multiple sugar transport system substrate-binding protein [Anaerocolumna jejuensis DSM 15929]|uniref:Multiple sugar transport system substrate-binding protein n=1 Tax=Anaerocolumna jejuensis DSM 15929 TaxID=1121322 RepID=A0A1M7CER5_9FIRM|nr:sugar ABC transporter substrate-binding protein [Anaerocolumna jejuensis]SHL65694.1 multiple sugar transport system substrate-binding protein [Anaerocolumna jejuensis DSM 15929]
MRSKKLLASILCVGLTISMLAGCGSKKDNSNPEPAATEAATDAGKENTNGGKSTGYTGEPAEIHYAYWQDSLAPYLEECKTKFESQNPNITIVLEPTTWTEYWTKLETAATGGSVADVFQMNGPNINKYAEAGIVLSLADYITSSGLDMNNYPAAMKDLYNVDSVQYGIPIDYDTIGLWYNKELFDAAGVSYPTDSWTWDDLKAAAKKLTNTEKNIYGISAGYSDQGGFYNTVFAAGGYILNEDKTACGFDQDATKQGIQCWIDLMKAGYSPSQASLSENADYIQFMSGKVAMLFAGDWFAANFADPKADFADKCDVALLPTINGKRASVIHGKANCISASSKNPDAAWAWVNYLAGTEANEILGKSGAAIPAYTGYSDLFFKHYPQYNMGIFSQEAKECAYTYPASKGFTQWADVVWNELMPVYSLEASLDDACANITSQMNGILEAQQ